MANLTRFDPLHLTRFEPFQDMFGNMLPSVPLRPLWERIAEPQIPVSIMETDKEFQLTAEIPGAHKEDIDVHIYENQVTINADMKEEKVAGMEGKLLCNERCTGKVSRSIRLPQDIDDQGAQAKYSDGVLQLTLPKKASSMAKHLAIH